MMSKWSQLGLLAAVELLAMSLWFSATAVIPQLSAAWDLSDAEKSWLTMSVQLGFVGGTLVSALFNLPDRIPPHRLVARGALAGAALNALIPLCFGEATGRTAGGFAALIALRTLTGVTLAGVYPPGMKLMATWFSRGRGLAIGVLVGALTAGSASPHLFNAILEFGAGGGTLKTGVWRPVLLAASGSAALAGIVAWLFVRPGSLLPAASRFDWSYALRVWSNGAVRRANFGYLGHMWELYAMWAWAPQFLLAAYRESGWDEAWGRVAGFALVAAGAVGCVAAGLWADRAGRTLVTSISMAVSGGCAIAAGWLFDYPLAATLVCLVWGLAVVADSAQFSTAVTELCEPGYVGTALTIQTCAGFLLTTATIRLVPVIEAQLGWGAAFAFLAIGPALGIWQMLSLRAMPDAAKMASGNR